MQLSDDCKFALTWGLVGGIVAFIICAALCVAVYGQERPLNTDATETTLPGGGKKLQIVRGLNYYDSATGIYKKRDVQFKASGVLPNKMVYREGHNVVVDTLTGYVNVNVGGNYVVFTPKLTDAPAILKEKNKVKYNKIWKHVDYRVELLPEGTKEYITLLNANAQTTFTFSAEFGAIPQMTGAGLYVGDFFIPAPTAIDANKNLVPVQWSLSAPSGGIYTYFMTVDTAGAVYPIIVDPSIVISSTGITDTDLRSSQPTHNAGAAVFLIAGESESNNSLLFKFDLSTVPSSAIIDSAIFQYTVIYDGGAVNGLTAYPLLKKWIEGTKTRAAADTLEPNFTYREKSNAAWGTGGARGAGTDYNASYGSSFSMNAVGTFTADIDTTIKAVVGIAKVQEDSGIVMIEDATNVERYIASTESTTVATRPQLTIYYHTGPSRAYNTSFISRTSDSTGLAFTDTSATAVYARLKNGSGVTIDSLYIPSTTTTLTDTLWHAGFTPNLKDTLYISTRDSSTGDTVNSVYKSGYTKANTPSPPSFGGFTTTTFDLTVNANSNPAITHYSVWDSTWRRWLKSDGDTTAQADTTWTTKADWDGTTITGRSRFTTYKFGVYGRNSDSVKTAFSGLTQTNSLLDSMQIFALDTNKFRLYADMDTFDLGDSLRFYVYKTGTSDTIWGDYLNYASTLVQDTITVTTGPNILYFGGVRIVQASSGPHYYTPIDSSRGLSMKIQSASITWTADTSFTLTITDTRNPANTGYFLLDSVRVDSSLAPYLNPDSVGYFNTKVYSSKAKLQLPIRIPRTQLTSGQAMRLRIFTSNRDSTGTGIP